MSAIITETKTCAVCNEDKEVESFKFISARWRCRTCNDCQQAKRAEQRSEWNDEKRAYKNELSRLRTARSRARLSSDALKAKRQAERARAAEKAGREYLSREDSKKHTAERRAKAKAERGPDRRRTHGMSGTPEYNSWRSAITRCSDPKSAFYYCYGGRGIIMTDEFMNSFPAFYEYMGTRPAGYSLDRIDPNGNYERGNMRWHPRAEESANRRPPSEWRKSPSESAKKGAMLRRMAKERDRCAGCQPLPLVLPSPPLVPDVRPLVREGVIVS